jgi:hypothetical protein
VSGRRNRSSFATVFAALVFAASGCVLSAIGEGADVESCENDADCAADENVCTEAVCQRGSCVQQPVSDSVVPEQPAGDCEVITCREGREQRASDPSDEEDDDNDCTTDTCDGSATTHVPVEDGEVCFSGSTQGSCVAGQCSVTCSDFDLSMCPGSNDPCEQRGCKNNECTLTPVNGPPVLDVMDDAGDCRQPFCTDGVLGEANDDGDAVEDDNECTIDSCLDGVPQLELASEGTACSRPGGAGRCTAAGECVECLEVSDCADPNARCENNSCRTCDVDEDCPDGFSCDAGTCFSCTDRVKNGSETDIDCGNAACGACLGTPCGDEAECASGFCVDGVCCNTECGSECVACREDLSGSPTGRCFRIVGASPECGGDEVCCTTKVNDVIVHGCAPEGTSCIE